MLPFLFTYSEQLSGDFHLNTIEEMCRLARRVFPLLNYDGELSPHLRPLTNELRARGYRAETKRASYDFQNGGNPVLCVEAPRDQRERSSTVSSTAFCSSFLVKCFWYSLASAVVVSVLIVS